MIRTFVPHQAVEVFKMWVLNVIISFNVEAGGREVQTELAEHLDVIYVLIKSNKNWESCPKNFLRL